MFFARATSTQPELTRRTESVTAARPEGAPGPEQGTATQPARNMCVTSVPAEKGVSDAHIPQGAF